MGVYSYIYFTLGVVGPERRDTHASNEIFMKLGVTHNITYLSHVTFKLVVFPTRE